MTLLAERLAPLALGLAAAMLCAASGATAMTLCFALPLALALVARGRAEASVPAQVLWLLGAGGAAVLATSLWQVDSGSAGGSGIGLAEGTLRPIHLQLGLAALLIAGLRLHLANAALGLAGTLGAGLLVFLACGTVRSGALYPGLLVAYGVIAMLALHAEGVVRGERRRLDARQRWAGGLLAALALGFTLALSVAIPRFYHAAYALALGFVGDHPVSGFHDGPLRLGVLRGMLESSEIVARVHGDAGDHLRGNVYVRYQRGRWLPADAGEAPVVRVRGIDDSSDARERAVARIVFAATDLDRFFLPTVEGDLAFAPVRVGIDRVGVARAADDAAPREVWVEATGPRAFPPAEPDDTDLHVPEAIVPDLTRLAGEWIAVDDSPRARVAALRRNLEQRHRYSLEQSEGSGGDDAHLDPILGFLLNERAGHCEYFASAMTLLARAAGFPARMVTGYRIDEVNPWGGYAIVRERHAHAWSEVHVAGEGWLTVDPSPIAGTSIDAANRTPGWSGLVDYLGVLFADFGAEVVLVVLVVGLAGVQLRRILAGRAGAPALESRPERGPPGHVARLLAHLAESGFERGAAESIEHLATRVADADTRDGPGARQYLLRYAALRYGDRGDASRLREDLEAWLAGRVGSVSSRREPARGRGFPRAPSA